MRTTYHPIACALHDEYEIAIMHKKPILIRWQDGEGEQRQEKILPKDILVKDKEEFLIATTSGDTELCIRLDRITLLE